MLTDTAAAGVEPALRVHKPRTRDQILERLRTTIAWDVTCVRVTVLCDWTCLPDDLRELGGRHRRPLDPATAHLHALALLDDVGSLSTWDVRQRLKAVEELLWVAGIAEDDLVARRPKQRPTDDLTEQRVTVVAHAQRLTELARHVEVARATAA